MNIGNLSSTNCTPTYSLLNLNQKIALLDKEVGEIRIVHDYLDNHRSFDKFVSYGFASIYVYSLVNIYFNSDQEHTAGKVREIALWTFAMGLGFFIIKMRPIYVKMWDHYGMLQLNFENYLKEKHLHISSHEIETKYRILEKYIPNSDEGIYLWDISDKLTSRNYRINLDKIMRVYQSEIGTTLPLELWREITHLVIKKTIYERK